MAGATNLFRRGAIYYYRRRIRWSGREACNVTISLRTACRDIARRRAIHLAHGCERLRMAVEDVMLAHPLSAAQRNEVFRRQVIAERDSLEVLEGAMRAAGYAEATTPALDEVLDVMTRVIARLIADGLPRPGDYKDLDEMIAWRFPDLTDLARLEVRAAFQALGDLDEWWNAVTREALLSVGAPVTPPNQHAIFKVLYEAKQQGVAQFWWHQIRPGDYYEALMREPSPGSGRSFDAFFAQSAEQPLLHLWNTSLHGCEPASDVGPQSDLAPKRTSRVQSAPQRTIPPADPWATRTIAETAELYIREHPNTGSESDHRLPGDWDAKTRRQFETAAMLIGKVHPGPISTLSQQDLLDLERLFRQLPSHHHKPTHHRSMSLQAICDEAAALHETGALQATIGLGPATINRHFRMIRNLCDFAAEEGAPMGVLKWKRLLKPDRRNPRLLRDALTVDQAAALFSLPIFTGCANDKRGRLRPGPHTFHDAAYWVPMIAWYSGARLGEICKILISDIHEVDGIWFVRMDDTESGRVKNERAKRSVVFHQEWIRLGLLDYIKQVSELGHTMLFPELIAGKIKPGEVWGKRWNRHLGKAIGLKPTQRLHAMRHSFDDELKYAGVTEEDRADILGHAHNSETADRYAKATRLSKLSEIIDKMPNVTAHLRPEPINLLPRVLIRTTQRNLSDSKRRTEQRPAGTQVADSRVGAQSDAAGCSSRGQWIALPERPLFPRNQA